MVSLSASVRGSSWSGFWWPLNIYFCLNSKHSVRQDRLVHTNQVCGSSMIYQTEILKNIPTTPGLCTCTPTEVWPMESGGHFFITEHLSTICWFNWQRKCTHLSFFPHIQIYVLQSHESVCNCPVLWFCARFFVTMYATSCTLHWSQVLKHADIRKIKLTLLESYHQTFQIVVECRLPWLKDVIQLQQSAMLLF